MIENVLEYILNKAAIAGQLLMSWSEHQLYLLYVRKEKSRKKKEVEKFVKQMQREAKIRNNRPKDK
jgi:hypothetical protein